MAPKYISIWFTCLTVAALGLAGSQPSAAGVCCFPAYGTCADASDGFATEADCVAWGGTWNAAYASCPSAGTCLCGEINDCDGHCAPANWLGDGDCDDYAWEWHGNMINLNCAALSWDGGDCTGGAGGACCFGDNHCEELGEPACVNAGGVLWLEGAPCDPNPCSEGDVSCPPDAIWAQSYDPSGFFSFSDTDGYAYGGGLTFDYFGPLSGPICDVHFWGFPYDWITYDVCPADTTFRIAFYADAGSLPDLSNPVSEYVRTLTPQLLPYEYWWYGYPAYEYEATLAPCCTLPSGWVSIAGTGGSASCLFVWLTSAVGSAWTDYGGSLGYDMAFCLTPPPPSPAGACCFADGSCQIETAADCVAAGGTYQGDGTDCDPNPCPAVSVKASAGSDKSICPGDSVKLSGSASGGTPPYSYSWSPTAGLSGADVAQPMASPTQTTTYTLTVTDNDGNKDTDTVKVSVGHTLVAGVVGGHGTILCEPPAPAVDGGSCFAHGAKVGLTADPDEGYRVKLWTGTDDDSKTTLTNTVTMTKNKTVTVEFELITARCTLAVEVAGEGTVSLDPPGGEYDSGTSVKLTATAKAGWRFDHWEGALSGAANPATLVMSDNKSVTAVFEQGVIQYTLGVTVEGEGTVTLDPPGGTYDVGTSVKLTATPDAGWHFVRWEGDAGGTSATTTVTMTRDRSTTAVFEPDTPVRYRLSIRIEGEGSVDPAGGTYAAGATVTLNATPEEGWRFARWEGDASGASMSAAVTMDRDRTVTAVFEENAPDDAGADDQSVTGLGAGRTSPGPCGSACPAASAGLIGVTLARLLRARGNGRRRVG
jgi:hypothetical protein